MNANPLCLFWEGFRLESYAQIDDQSLLIRLQPADDCLPRCSGCNEKTSAIHDTHIRRLRERDLFQYRVWLEVPVRRVRCPTCGPKLEDISWLSGRQRLTVSMINWVESLVRLMPVQHVATQLSLHWHTVKAIDHQRLKKEVQEPDKSQLRRLIMDEFALFKATDTPPWWLMPTRNKCFGWEKVVAGPRYDRSLSGWDLKRVAGLKLSPWT